ncbi:MAG: hypothetical protein RMK84_07095 [Oscillochloridaceae bacterium]|nr:hypothetical protein [Chloroflexaceae bacterium]MDW8389876.1 hypothetical protein [Oscillochloridaceae bacterium]
MTDMTETTDDVTALVSEGNAALIAGDTYTARQRFRAALERDPRRVDALIGMAGSVRPYREKREHLLRALEIDPDNEHARAVLEQVEARLAAGEVLAPGGVREREPQPAPAPEAPPAPPSEATVAPAATRFCYLHPDRETGLRCTSCDRPICADCVRPAAVGQLCPECARARRPVNYQVSAVESAIAGATTVVYSILVSTLAFLLLSGIGFFGLLVALLLGPVAGDLLVRLTDRFTRGKRGQLMQLTVGIAYVAGFLFMLSGLAVAMIGVLSPGVIGALFIGMPLGLHLFNIITIVSAVMRLR